MTDALASFTNTADGVTSFVFKNVKSGFNVTLRDDDSGEFVGAAICGIKNLDAAIAKAKEII